MRYKGEADPHAAKMAFGLLDSTNHGYKSCETVCGKKSEMNTRDSSGWRMMKMKLSAVTDCKPPYDGGGLLLQNRFNDLAREHPSVVM